MPPNRTKKTASGLSKLLPFSWFLIGLALLAVTACYQRPKNLVSLRFKDRTIYLEKAETSEAHQKGLSGREFMAKNRGMMFIFAEPNKDCFWMKDMEFALDFIWLDDRKIVIETKENIQPSTYPAESFCPSQPAKYVIELRAGTVQELNTK